MIDFRKGYTSMGEFNMNYLYVNTFGVIPDFSVYGLEKANYIDLKGIETAKLQAAYPDAKICFSKIKSWEDSTSCVDDEDDEGDTYGTEEVWVAGITYRAKVRIFDEKRKLFIIMDSMTLIFYYTDYTDFVLEDEVKRLLGAVPKKAEEKNEKPGIHLVCCENGYFTVKSSINRTTLDMDRFYNDDFKEAYANIESFLTSKEKKSGVIVLNGLPGTGKSTLIRHIVTNIPGKYILITPAIAAHMSDPELISFLMSNKNSVFIMEDCENVIMDRTVNSFASAVSSLLNMTDGILSDIFNGKFICTFNVDISKVDSALLRKGRCFANYEFGKLSEEKTKALLESRGVKLDKYERMTVADIFNYGENCVGETVDRPKIGFTR